MTHEDLMKHIKEELDNAYEVMRLKNSGYSTEKDALHNFTVAAELQDRSPAQVLGGYLAKHIVSVYDLINSTPIDRRHEIWNEKITDSIVYLAILHAMMHDACQKTVKESYPEKTQN